MSVNMRLIKAVQLATEAHAGQKYDGKPYVLHPLRVAARAEAEGYDEALVVAAILHDVVEDTDVTVEQIEDTFGFRVAGIVEAVSRRDDESYEAFIDRVCRSGGAARAVKLLDMRENLSCNPRPKNRARYEAAIEKVENYHQKVIKIG